MNYLERNNILNIKQFGFRKSKSVHHAVLALINNLCLDLSKNTTLGVLLLDIEKAFDTVLRDNLIAKLSHYGVGDVKLQWFRSYLSERCHVVSYGGQTSSFEAQSNSGVLQGSALSAGLFILYINDLISYINTRTGSDVILYADDCSISFQMNNDDCIKEVSNCIKYWYESNSISINKGKSEVLLFSNSKSSNGFFSGDFHIFNSSNLTHEARYLGIILNDKFDFTSSFNNTLRKCSIGISALTKVKNFYPQDAKISLYYAFVHSHLNFVSYYLCSLNSRKINSLFKFQKRAVRVIKNIQSFSHTAEHFQALNILPLEKLIDFNIFKFVYNLRFHLDNEEIFPYWQQNITVQSLFNRTLRSSHKLRIPFVRNKYQKLPIVKFPLIYNKYIDIFLTFPIKNRWENLKKYLLDEYVAANSCRMKECYVCNRLDDLRGVDEERRKKKISYLKEIIRRKGLQRKERFKTLLKKYEKLRK